MRVLEEYGGMVLEGVRDDELKGVRGDVFERNAGWCPRKRCRIMRLLKTRTKPEIPFKKHHNLPFTSCLGKTDFVSKTIELEDFLREEIFICRNSSCATASTIPS